MDTVTVVCKMNRELSQGLSRGSYNVQLVGVAQPLTQCLNETVNNPIICHHCGSTNTESMTWEWSLQAWQARKNIRQGTWDVRETRILTTASLSEQNRKCFGNHCEPQMFTAATTGKSSWYTIDCSAWSWPQAPLNQSPLNKRSAKTKWACCVRGDFHDCQEERNLSHHCRLKWVILAKNSREDQSCGKEMSDQATPPWLQGVGDQ